MHLENSKSDNNIFVAPTHCELRQQPVDALIKQCLQQQWALCRILR